MLTPKLNLEKFSIEEYVDHSVITDQLTGTKVSLEKTDSKVLRVIDGVKDVKEISLLLSNELEEEDVFRALDRLSDIGILMDRLLPPSGGQVSSRRKFLTKVIGSLAVGAIFVSPVAFADKPAQQQEQKEKRELSAAEKDYKKAQKEARKLAKKLLKEKERAWAMEEKAKKKLRRSGS